MFRFRQVQKRVWTLSMMGALTALGGGATAQTKPGIAQVIPGASGQQTLAIEVRSTEIVAQVCTAAACNASSGKALLVPADVVALLGKAKIRSVNLAGGKHIGRIDVPGASEGQAWVMLVAAPLTGKGQEPIVLWSGWTGVAKGEHGEEQSGVVIGEATGQGQRILVGLRREDVTICGRPTVVAAREVDPATITLARGASVQNLSDVERRNARKIIAERREGDDKAAPFRLLRPTAASSAIGKRFTEISDGDANTTWSEAKKGDGRGEFVTFSSASEVGITGLSIRIKPLSDVPEGAAPKTFFVATEDRLFQIAMPEDAWLKPSATYTLKFPEALKTSCLALVLDEAYIPSKAPNVPITIAEVTASTAHDEQSVENLVGALVGGDDRAKAAAALLARSGPAGIGAAIAGYDKLDDAGKQLAAGVIDAAPCADQMPFFTQRFAVGALSNKKEREGLDPEMHHIRDRIRRCGRVAATALAKIVSDGPDAAKIAAARELALVAPAEAIATILDAIAKASGTGTRRELRGALAHAARSDRASEAVVAEVSLEKFRTRPLVVQIDFLRALGPALGRIPGSREAFQLLATKEAPFRTRYLLQVPAAELARAHDTAAESYLRMTLKSDADRHVRARAAEASARVPALMPDLVAAIQDTEVRVREASIAAIARAMAAGAKPPSGLSPALVTRLSTDPWTFVRAASARALGALPASATSDKALATALFYEASYEVRGHILDALGAHRATLHIEAVRDRAEDSEEHIEVRARAILALAALCDKSSVDLWTKLALRAKFPVSERDYRLGTASLAALGQVHPSDLKSRLAPLLSKDTPRGLQEMAKAAIGTKRQCR